MIEQEALKQEIAALEKSIESKVKAVSTKLESIHKIEELKDDAAELTRLIARRKYKLDLLALFEPDIKM